MHMGVHLTLSANAARAGAAGNEFFHQRQKKSLAEMAELRVRLKVERLADDVLIVFVKDDPEAQRSVETGTTLFHLRNFDGKTIGGWWLAGDRKQHQQILTLRPGNPHTHSHRARLAAFGLPALSFAHPQLG